MRNLLRVLAVAVGIPAITSCQITSIGKESCLENCQDDYSDCLKRAKNEQERQVCFNAKESCEKCENRGIGFKCKR
jgi:hypothetical protein